MSGIEAIPVVAIEDWARYHWPLSVRRLVRRITTLDAAVVEFLEAHAKTEREDKENARRKPQA